MTTQVPADRAGNLGDEMRKRLAQLGLTRRELARRTGLSRQTLHNIEYGTTVDYRPQTLAVLDRGLMWQPGTSASLVAGESLIVAQSATLSPANHVRAYRWRIVEKLQSMSLEELERLISFLESDETLISVSDSEAS